MQVDPIKPKLKPPGKTRLKLKYEGPLSNFAFNFNLRRYSEALAVESYTTNAGTGWNLPGDAIRFGRCGLVGDHWAAMEVEFTLACVVRWCKFNRSNPS